MPKSIYKIRRKQAELKPQRVLRIPARFGDGFGHLRGTKTGMVYVVTESGITEAFCGTTMPVYGAGCWISKDYDRGGTWQVVGSQGANPAGVLEQSPNGFAEVARALRLYAKGGGQAPLWVEGKQIMPGLIFPATDYSVNIYQNIVRTGAAFTLVDSQSLDLSAHQPAGAGDAVLVLITVDTSGAIVHTAGAEYVLADMTTPALVLANLPAIPAGTALVLGAVRLFYAQDAISEGRANYTDIIDLRWAGIAAASTSVIGGPFDYIDFNTGATVTNQEGRLYWNATDGTLNIGMPGGEVTNQIGQEVLLPRRVKNDTGADMKNGQLVYISGGDGTNANVTLAKADAEATSAATIAMLTEDIDDNHSGYAVILGLARGSATQPIDTSAGAPGTVVYLSPATAGAFTITKPVAPNHMVVVGTIFRQHATEGSIIVHIENGFELDELHDVLITGIAQNDFLVRGAATWQNLTPANARTAIGLVAGGAGDIWVYRAGDTSTGQQIIQPATDVIKFILKHSGAGATTSFQQMQTAAGVVLAEFDSSGFLKIGNPASGNASANILRTNSGTGQSALIASYVNTGAFADNFGFQFYGFSRNTTGTAARTGAAFYSISHDRAGTVTNLFQMLGRTAISAGTVTNYSFLYADQFAITGGTVVNSRYINIPSPVISGAGSITNLYGLYIADQIAGATLNYAIYTNGGLVRFGDQVSIDGSADRQQLVVTGHTTQTLPVAQFTDNTAATNTVRDVGVFEADSTGTAAAGFGAAIVLKAETATNNTIATTARLETVTTDAAAATHNDRLQFETYPSGSAVGHMAFWSGTAIDGTAQTIIANGTGDVTKVITLQYTSAEITGTDVSGGVVVLEPGDTFTVLTDITNTLTLTCAADGSVTIARSAGTDTYKFAATMVWL